jgi:broad specificity phosphatase PhoE
MTLLGLVRHGLTDWNIEGRYQGSMDQPLNATGIAQAQTLAAHLEGRSYAWIFASDLLRAQATASIIAERLKIPLDLEPRLREINQGEWEGMLIGDIKAQYADLWQARLDDPEHARPPGGETIGEVSRRVCGAADDIARRWPDGKILIVSHGMAIATLLAKARNRPLTEAFMLIPQNTEIVEVAWEVA